MPEPNKPDDDFNKKVKAYLKDRMMIDCFEVSHKNYTYCISLKLDDEEIDRTYFGRASFD